VNVLFYLLPVSFRLTLPRGVLFTYWCCPSRPCEVWLATCRRAFGIVPCIISFSRQLPCFLMFPFWQCRTIPSLHQLCSKLICFLCYRPCRIFFSPFISKASRRVSSFFLSIQSSQPYVATGHISAFIRRIFVEIDILWLFHIFCSDAPIACCLLHLVRNSVVHSPSSAIRDPRYGNVSTCSSCLFWISMRHAVPSLAVTLVLLTLISRPRLYLRLSRSRRFTRSCSSPLKWPTGWCRQRSEGSWLFYLKIYRWSPSSPSALGC